jgi:flagellar biosynthesis/type III secretory pathway M-ring protein FliF/YscJ
VFVPSAAERAGEGTTSAGTFWSWIWRVIAVAAVLVVAALVWLLVVRRRRSEEETATEATEAVTETSTIDDDEDMGLDFENPLASEARSDEQLLGDLSQSNPDEALATI